MERPISRPIYTTRTIRPAPTTTPGLHLFKRTALIGRANTDEFERGDRLKNSLAETNKESCPPLNYDAGLVRITIEPLTERKWVDCAERRDFASRFTEILTFGPVFFFFLFSGVR